MSDAKKTGLPSLSLKKCNPDREHTKRDCMLGGVGEVLLVKQTAVSL